MVPLTGPFARFSGVQQLQVFQESAAYTCHDLIYIDLIFSQIHLIPYSPNQVKHHGCGKTKFSSLSMHVGILFLFFAFR